MIRCFSRPWQVDAVGIAACVIITVAAYIVVVAPMLTESQLYSSQRTNLIEWSAQTSRLSQLAANLGSRVEITQSRVAATPLVLEPANALNSRLNDINNIAASERLAVDGINVRTPVTTEENITFPIEFAGSGQFGDLIKFFDRVNKEMSAMGVVAFRVTQGTSDTSFVLDLAWYAGQEPDDQLVHVE